MRIIDDLSVFTTQKARMLQHRQNYSSYVSGKIFRERKYI